MADLLNNTIRTVAESINPQFNTISTFSTPHSLPNKITNVASNNNLNLNNVQTLRQERNSKIMIENLENFCDPNWANNGFQHMEGNYIFFSLLFF